MNGSIFGDWLGYARVTRRRYRKSKATGKRMFRWVKRRKAKRRARRTRLERMLS
jgi:hypothetical protein